MVYKEEQRMLNKYLQPVIIILAGKNTSYSLFVYIWGSFFECCSNFTQKLLQNLLLNFF